MLREIKKGYKRLVIPTILQGSETWSLRPQKERNFEVFEMMRQRNICCIKRNGRGRNLLIREKCG